MSRNASIRRKTRETAIELSLALDGEGRSEVATGVGFLDHMLTLFSRHSLSDLVVRCEGDTEVDDHHTTEDCGIVLGDAVREALGDKTGVRRYGHAAVVLDEALVEATIDLSGRPFFVAAGEWPAGKIGTWDAELAVDFLQAFAAHAGATLHVEVVRGRNAHHVVECAFKALARALREAAAIDGREKGVPSSKGTL